MHQPTFLAFLVIMMLLCFLSWLLTGLVRRFAVNSKLLDVPNERSSHKVATPSGGGLAIVVVFVTGIIFLTATKIIELNTSIAVVGGGSAIAFIGYLDDRRNISPLLRLVVHAIAAFWLVAFVGGQPKLNLLNFRIEASWVVHLLELIGVIWCINLYNFMDGIDGLAGGQAVFIGISSTFLALLAGTNYTVSILMAVATAGFLVRNWPPAQIFMGDVGSGFLGFLIASLVVISNRYSTTPILSWLVLMSVFFIDSTYTLLRRAARGEKWYSAHRTHAYQHAAQRFGSHTIVTIAIMLINILWLFPISISMLYNADQQIELTLVALCPILILIVYFRAGENSQHLT